MLIKLCLEVSQLIPVCQYGNLNNYFKISKKEGGTIWYLTTTHSGNAKRLKYLKNIVLADDGVSRFQHFLYYRIPSFFVMPKPLDRISIFFTDSFFNFLISISINHNIHMFILVIRVLRVVATASY